VKKEGKEREEGGEVGNGGPPPFANSSIRASVPGMRLILAVLLFGFVVLFM